MIAGSTIIMLQFFLPLFACLITFFHVLQRFMARSFLLLQMLTSFLLIYTIYYQGPIAISGGSWTAPFGIILVVDAFAALMLSFSSTIFACCFFEVDKEKDRTLYWPLIFLLQSGVNLVFMTGDLFNLFVALELMLVSSYAILVTQGSRAYLNNAYSYLLMNLLASFIYLIATALFYSYTGELNFAALSKLLESSDTHLKWIPVFTLLLAVAIKSGLFPFHFWQQDTYLILPGNLVSLFSSVLSKVGVYIFFRLLLTVFPQNEIVNLSLKILASLTMFFGVMGEVSRKSIPGILSYHTLIQVGYSVVALSLATPMAITAGLFFILHNMIVKSSLFLIAEIAGCYCGSKRFNLMGGLLEISPFLGVLFLLQAFSLAGLPPFSGFWVKYLLFFESITIEAYGVVFISVITSFFTLFSMIKIWNTAFIGEKKPEMKEDKQRKRLFCSPGYKGAILLTILALYIGIFPRQPFQLVEQATNQLLNHELYINRVLSAIPNAAKKLDK